MPGESKQVSWTAVLQLASRIELRAIATRVRREGEEAMSYFDEIDRARDRSDFEANALLFSWLTRDEHRSKLYAQLRESQPVLEFESRAGGGAKGQRSFRRPAVLLTRKDLIAQALQHFSSDPYKAIGSGTFVLASNNGSPDYHERKRAFLAQALRYKRTGGLRDEKEVHKIAFIACHHALVGPSKGENFDLVRDVAEQAALRFVAGYFGFPDGDHVLLQTAMRKGYEAMIYQMFARHFVTDPIALPEGNKYMGVLAERVAQLIDEARASTLHADVTSLFDGREVAALRALEMLRNEIVLFEGRAASALDKAWSEIEATGLGRVGAEIIDRSADFEKIHTAIDEDIFVAPDDSPAREIFEGLVALLAETCEEKREPDDHLVPRKERVRGRLRFRETVIDRLARNPGSSSGSELAATVVGTIAGLVGNITAGVCIAINEFFQDEKRIKKVNQLARKGLKTPNPTLEQAIEESIPGAEALKGHVMEALRLNPPAAFIPRLAEAGMELDLGDGEKRVFDVDTEVVLAIGAATRDLERKKGEKPPDEFDEKRDNSKLYVFGHEDTGNDSHRCLGEHLSIPLICQIVRGVLLLPELARPLDERTEEPEPLEKKWGYICESFPMAYNRDDAIMQHPLNVIMKVKTPVSEHAEKLKLVIRYGAPMIEQLLEQSQIVHFARFLFLDNDSKLALITTYDGDFDPYLRHFARAAGPLFDQIFEHIEDPPPLPVRDHQDAFVKHIERFDVESAGGYFYSAHPKETVRKEGK